MNESFLWTITQNDKKINLEEIVYTLTEMYTTGYINNTPSISKVCYFTSIKIYYLGMVALK